MRKHSLRACDRSLLHFWVKGGYTSLAPKCLKNIVSQDSKGEFGEVGINDADFDSSRNDIGVEKMAQTGVERV